jgi:hypothetical protein
MPRYRTADDDSLSRQISDLADRVARLERSTRGPRTSVDEGDFIIRGGGSLKIFDGGGIELPSGSILGPFLAEQIGATGGAVTYEGVSATSSHTSKGYDQYKAPDWATSALVFAVGSVNLLGANQQGLVVSMLIGGQDIIGNETPMLWGAQAVEGASIGPYVAHVSHIAYLDSLPSDGWVQAHVLASRGFSSDLGFPSYGTPWENFVYITTVVLWLRG